MSDTQTDPHDTQNDLAHIPLTALLRAGRNTFARAIRPALAEAECDDIPRNGIYMLVALARFGAPYGQIVRDMAISKQAASQLVDTLVLRGYLDRAPDPQDRRRQILTPTPRGHAAAAACRAAVDKVQEALLARVGEARLAATRETLAALAGLDDPLAD